MNLVNVSGGGNFFLSILTIIFPGGPGLAGTRMSPFCIY